MTINTMHERIQGQLASEEHLVNKNVDIGEAIRKFVVAHTRRQKTN